MVESITFADMHDVLDIISPLLRTCNTDGIANYNILFIQGAGDHFYRASKTDRGTEYIKQKQFNPNSPHVHSKV